MSPNSQELVVDALDKAFLEHVCKLFGVLVSASFSEGVDPAIDRFKQGLTMAVGLHTRLVEDLTGDDHAA